MPCLPKRIPMDIHKATLAECMHLVGIMEKKILIQIKLSTFFFFFKSKRFRVFINLNLFPQMILTAGGEFIKTMYLQFFCRDKFALGQCFCLSGKSFLLSSCWFIQGGTGLLLLFSCWMLNWFQLVSAAWQI